MKRLYQNLWLLAGLTVAAGFGANFYTSLSLSDRLKTGLGVNTPFGLAIEYQPGWVGRYQALNSRLITTARSANPA